MTSELQWKLGFLSYAEVHTISAKEGKGLAALMRSVDAAYAAAMARLSTPKLTRALIAAIEKQAPPRAGVIRPKLRYAHQGGVAPRIIIHGKRLGCVPDSYNATSRATSATSSSSSAPHGDRTSHRAILTPARLRKSAAKEFRGDRLLDPKRK